MRLGKIMLATIAMVLVPAVGAQAAAAPAARDKRSANHEDDVTVLAPNLVVAKIADRDPVFTGETLRWTITVRNTGEEAAVFGAGEPMLRDDLPAGLSGVTAWGGVYGCAATAGSDRTLLCSATSQDTIAPGEERIVTVTATAPSAAGTITNRAVVDPAGIITESNEQDNVARATTTIRAHDDEDDDKDNDKDKDKDKDDDRAVARRVNLRAGIIPASDTAEAGEELEWTIRALNAGHGNIMIPAGTPLVRVTVPEGLDDAVLSGDGYDCSAVGLVWTCTALSRDKIKRDDPAVFTLTGTAPDEEAVLIVRVLVDPSDRIRETNESDNAATSVVTVEEAETTASTDVA